MDSEERKRLAYHEAAHAAIAIRLGCHVHCVEVSDNAGELSDGRYCQDAGGVIVVDFRSGSLKTTVRIMLAGFACEVERNFLIESHFLFGVLEREEGDVGRAVAEATEDGIEDARHFVEDQWEATKRLVRKEGSSIQRLATELILAERLEAQKVLQLVAVASRIRGTLARILSCFSRGRGTRRLSYREG